MSKPATVTPIKGNQGGITNDKIKHIAQTITEAKASAKDFTDSANESVNAFGEDGGHKKAIRDAQKLQAWADRDAAGFADYWRALEQYMDVLGVFAQADTFDIAAE